MAVPRKPKILWPFLCAALFFGGMYLSTALLIGQSVYADTKAPSDAILVLGAASYRGNSYNPCLVSRVKHAVELRNAGYAPSVIVSGGNDLHTGVNESETMQKIAEENGLPPDALVREEKARSTYENILLSSRIMKERGWKSVVIVTEPFHAPRAGLIARHLGIRFTVSPAVDSPCWQRWKFLSRYFLREPLAVLYYKFTGKL